MRWLRLLLAFLCAAALVAGIDLLSDLTENRSDDLVAGTRTTITFEVSSRRDGGSRLADAQALWGTCQSTVHAVAVAPGVRPAGPPEPGAARPGRFVLTVEPRVGHHGMRRLRGCLEDATVDLLQARVVAVRHQPPLPADSSGYRGQVSKPPTAVLAASFGVPNPGSGDSERSDRRVTRWWRHPAILLVVVFLALLLAGNATILGAHAWAQGVVHGGRPPALGIHNARVVDARLWRGAAPGRDGYRALAADGVRTVVDLRAEEYVQVDEPLLRQLGLRLVRIPIRDGQVPTARQVASFVATVRDGPGLVYVHCGAGVGRTGAMTAAYLVATGQSSPVEALRRNLAVGPPSLEQIAFTVGLDRQQVNPTPAVVTAASRLLDAPRRLWSRLTAPPAST